MTQPSMTPAIPPESRRGFDWAAVAATCRADPGTWYSVDNAPPNVNAWQVKNGLLAALRPVGEWEARVVKRVLYVRALAESS
jgi:hypothetical protein